MFPTKSFLIVALLCLTVTRNAGMAPRPNFTNPYENKTNKTIDQVISDMLGGMDTASTRIIADDEADDGKILAELDMYLSRDQFLHMYQPPNAEEMYKMDSKSAPVGVGQDEMHFSDHTQEKTFRQKRKAVRDTTRRWTNEIIPYFFASGHFNSQEQYMMRRSLTEWERYTCLQFKPATNQDNNSVRFQNGDGCTSYLGMVGGVQDVNLEAPGCRYKGLYLHELGHAIGLVHEHQLPDRDSYINVLYENVQPKYRVWFYKYTPEVVDQMKVPYEYSSVMHYGITAFSVDGIKQTIRALDQSRQAEIGEIYLKELSYTDVKIVNLMYNCSRNCPDKNKCGDDGYLDQNCECICQDGSSDCDRTKTKNGQCVNDYNSWACYVWANQGECERYPDYMKSYCKKACGVCGGGTQGQSQCKDFYTTQKCSIWKERGDCLTNVGWMTNNCRATCGFCGDASIRPENNCSNTYSDQAKCEEWAMIGECSVHPELMFDNCKKSCAMCLETKDRLDCQDYYKNCEAWVRRGDCNTNPELMALLCQKSCQKC